MCLNGRFVYTMLFIVLSYDENAKDIKIIEIIKYFFCYSLDTILIHLDSYFKYN